MDRSPKAEGYNNAPSIMQAIKDAEALADVCLDVYKV